MRHLFLILLFFFQVTAILTRENELVLVRKSEAEEIEKNNNKVRFEYELYGVVVQSGNLNGGHYVSYTKHIIK